MLLERPDATWAMLSTRPNCAIQYSIMPYSILTISKMLFMS
ncbi:hypothetical protein DSUL_20057 [Desulfovibrionales bacterium]